MNPIRNLSIIALFLLASTSAYAVQTATLVVHITVTISANINVEWQLGDAYGARTWTVSHIATANACQLNTAYASLNAPTALGDIIDGAAGSAPIATAFNVKNNTAANLTALTIKSTNGTNWKIDTIANHPTAENVLVRFVANNSNATDVLLPAGNGYIGGDTKGWTDVTVAPVALTSLVQGASQLLALEFITPYVLAATPHATDTIDVTITATCP